MEKKFRYTSTDCFKVGETVWVTGVSFTPSGRYKYLVTPTQSIITAVAVNSITVESLGYRIPSTYFLDSPEKWVESEVAINPNIAKTKKIATENFNYRLKEEIEERYESFRRFESKVISYLF